MPALDELQVFIHVAQEGSLSAAAAKLGLTRSAISRRVQALEHRLGVRLLDRTTRRLELTDAGRVFLRRGQRVMAEMLDAEAEASDYGSEPRGVLRVSSLVMIGLRLILPLLPDFLREHPGVRVELDLSDAATGSNLAAHDVAICWGEQVNSGLIATRLLRSRQVFCASPAYLSRHGTPEHPDELASHACLLLARHGTTANEWQFATAEGPSTRNISGSLVLNSGDALYEAVLLGLGIGRVTDLTVRQDVAAGRLRYVLERWTPRAGTPVYVMYRRGRHVPPKVRAFVSYLRSRVGLTEARRDRKMPP